MYNACPADAPVSLFDMLLLVLQLSAVALPNNYLTGTLPDSWGSLTQVSTPSPTFAPIVSYMFRANANVVRAPLSGMLYLIETSLPQKIFQDVALHAPCILLHTHSLSFATVIHHTQEHW